MDEDDGDAALRAALGQLAFATRSAAALSSTLDAVVGLGRVCRVLVPGLADWSAADLVDEDGVVERVCFSHRDPNAALTGLTGPLPPVPETATGPLSRVLRGAGPLLLSAGRLPTAQEASDPLHTASMQPFARLGGDSVIVAPLRARRRVLGALTLVRGEGHPPWGEADLALVEDLTHRIALALDNARLYAETQAVAERLQRSLLPDLPVVPGLRVTARYSPAAATAQIGGDWYDSFVLPESGDTTLIIGDVTGHDLHAAVTMSQIRNMLRGIACDRREPPRHDPAPLGPRSRRPLQPPYRHLRVRTAQGPGRRAVPAGVGECRTSTTPAGHRGRRHHLPLGSTRPGCWASTRTPNGPVPACPCPRAAPCCCTRTA